MIMKAIRFVLGKIILFLDFVFAPKGMIRPPDLQARVDAETKDLTLYQLLTCPFCVKVRRELKRLSVTPETKDIQNPEVHAELMAGGKIDQVPCLKIKNKDGSVRFLYESKAINEYLINRFQAIDL
jgi:glutaredoxin